MGSRRAYEVPMFIFTISPSNNRVQTKFIPSLRSFYSDIALAIEEDEKIKSVANCVEYLQENVGHLNERKGRLSNSTSILVQTF